MDFSFPLFSSWLSLIHSRTHTSKPPWRCCYRWRGTHSYRCAARACHAQGRALAQTHTHAHAYAYAYMHTHTHTNTHIYIYTRILPNAHLLYLQALMRVRCRLIILPTFRLQDFPIDITRRAPRSLFLDGEKGLL